ncbi:MAG TPA: glutamate-5-semialdehyde dehydrogenase [Rhizomicrobium sp.]|jgi:glutamate-5-semialdehyde dehydrogenase|nr:glutamate-5-semialdehyde dehydrogenase [Rhizomicrobium sp.]
MNADIKLREEMIAMGRSAKIAAFELRNERHPAERREGLLLAAKHIRHQAQTILAANLADLERGRAAGLSHALLDRLLLDEERIEVMAKSVEDVAALPDPVGRQLSRWTVPSGLDIACVSTPIGVIGMIYESRPNVTADAAALCVRSGNAVILRGGSEASESNIAIHRAFIEGIREVGMLSCTVQLVHSTDRAAVGLMLEGLGGAIDLIIPRGGKSLTSRVVAEARVPVIAHLEGVCHVYIHAGADPAKARAIAVNSKMRRTSVCGAAETLLIDRGILPTIGVAVFEDLAKVGCEIRGDEAVRAVFPDARAASEADWSTEYSDAIVAVKVVDGVEDAIHHIEQYGSHHTDSIVTEIKWAAEGFLESLDSAIVLWNASTQFADGAEFGMGAEIGIGTGKLHARGPVGAEQLTTFKYIVRGTGQIRP